MSARWTTAASRAADTLKPVIDAIINSNRSCEIDATRVEKGEDVETNLTVLEAYINYVLDSIFSMPGRHRRARWVTTAAHRPGWAGAAFVVCPQRRQSRLRTARARCCRCLPTSGRTFGSSSRTMRTWSSSASPASSFCGSSTQPSWSAARAVPRRLAGDT